LFLFLLSVLLMNKDVYIYIYISHMQSALNDTIDKA